MYDIIHVYTYVVLSVNVVLAIEFALAFVLVLLWKISALEYVLI